MPVTLSAVIFLFLTWSVSIRNFRELIKVTNATSIHCVELLENGQVDLIVVNSPNPYLGNCETKHIRSFQDVFVANHSLINLSEDA